MQKALAFAILLKHCLGRSSMMRDYSINKIHLLTKVSPTTINKYLPMLIENGWVGFCGKDGQHLVVKRLCSQTRGRNITIDKFGFESFSDVYRSVRAFVALLIQVRKEYVRRTIQIVANPQKGDNFYAARKLLKRLVKQNILSDIYAKYKEYGLSLKTIAKETGNCVRTAQRIMSYVVEHGWANRQHHYEQVFAPRVNFRHVCGYTFATRNNLYIVRANTYDMTRSVIADFSHGNIWW